MKKNLYHFLFFRKMTALLAMVFMLSGTSFAQWAIYDASVLPNEIEPAFITASASFSESENAIINDPEIDGNKLLWMDVSGNPNNQFFWRMNFLTQEIQLEEITVVVRIKGHPDRDMALDMDLDFNGHRSRVSLLNGENPEARIRNGTGDNVFPEVDYLEWNIYRFTMTAETTRLYINENPDPVMVFTPATGTNRHFRFGDGDSGRTFGADIDWVIWDISGDYAPGEGLPIPQELLAPTVDTGWKVYDGSLFPNEFEPPFATASGSFNESENAIINDPEIEDNKLLWMDVSGNPNNQFMWRMNFVTHEIELEELTLVMRIRGHEGRDMAMDVDLDFNGYRSRISLLNGETPEARIRNGSGNNAFPDVDFMKWNIYRLTMTAEETRLYINEDPDPVMVFTPATGTNRHFRLGDGDSGRTFGADIDWVVWDYTGAYEPGTGQEIPEGLDTSYYIPEEPEPHNWRIYDASVFPNESGPVFMAASGAFSESENAIVDDPGMEGNSLLSMDVSGNPNNQFLWRMNFINHDVELEALTLVMRVKGHADRDMAMDVDLDFGGHRSRISLLNGETPEARIRNGSGDNAFPEVDLLDWNTYRFTMTAEETRMYINEDPDPVMVFTPATGSNRHFRFGDGDSGRTFGADIDWVVWDFTGAFAPGEGSEIPNPVVTPNWDATLASLLVDGASVDNFDAEVTEYQLVLPAGTTAVPQLSATANYAGATVEITQAEALPGEALVVVTAANGFTINTYKVSMRMISTDASLADLKVNDVTIDGFRSDRQEYVITLTQGTTEVPVVTAVANDALSTVEITPAVGLPGETIIEVTAEDGNVMRVTILFQLDTTSVGEVDELTIRVYPNPASNVINIDSPATGEHVKLRLISMYGQVVMHTTLSNTVDISNLNKGMYVLQVIEKDRTFEQIFIKQ